MFIKIYKTIFYNLTKIFIQENILSYLFCILNNMPDIHIERLETNIQPHEVRFVLARFHDRLVVKFFSSRIHVNVSDDLWIEK
jgi:hypothetical protein